MKVIISRPELVAIIGKIQSVVPNKPAMPILANILVEAYGNHITLSGTDLTVSAKVQMEAHIKEEGAITLPARRFFQLVREMRAPEVEIECGSNEIATIRTGSSTFRLNGIHKSEFPTLPNLSNSISFSMDGATFKEVLAKSVFAAAKEDSRHVLNGVLMHIQSGEATFIGTDGKKLAKILTPVELSESHIHDYLLPIKAVDELVKMIEAKTSVTINLLPDKIGIELGNYTLITKLLSGDFPDVERIIPKHSEFSFTLHREELMSLLKQVALFTTETCLSVQFIFSPGELTLLANTSEIGEGKVSMPVDYSGENLQIAFNPLFFHDILRHCKDETVSFSITNAHHPGLITDSSKAKFVIMPMRLSQSG